MATDEPNAAFRRAQLMELRRAAQADLSARAGGPVPRPVVAGLAQPGAQEAASRRGEATEPIGESGRREQPPIPFGPPPEPRARTGGLPGQVRTLPSAEHAPSIPQHPPIPISPPKRSHATFVSFVLVVLLPIFLATVYYGSIASNQYVSEFRFSVKNAAVPSPTPSSSGLMGFLGGSPMANSSDSYLVVDYLTSPAAVEALESRIQVTKLYARPNIDWWMRFDASRPIEDFVKYWQGMITANYDMITGLGTAQIRAFTPHDAHLIASTLLSLSEELVNQIATRSQNDAVRNAEKEVENAQNRLMAIRARLAAYRNKVGVIDPASSVVASNSGLIQAVRANLAQLETRLATMMARRLAKNAPAVVALQSEIKATKQQLAQLEASVGAEQGGGALSTTIGEYEQLDLERQFAQTLLTSAMQALEQAKANAAIQHLYVTPYVRPGRPQSATYPKRLTSVLVVAVLAFLFWTIGLLIVRAISERFG